MLETQNYKCLHCSHKLECIIGTQIKKNGWCASLDRINVDIVGYGNGNSQWLCMSCNNGKNTMDNLEHKEKFESRDRKIRELESEVEKLKNIINKSKYKNAVQRLDVGGSE